MWSSHPHSLYLERFRNVANRQILPYTCYSIDRVDWPMQYWEPKQRICNATNQFYRKSGPNSVRKTATANRQTLHKISKTTIVFILASNYGCGKRSWESCQISRQQKQNNTMPDPLLYVREARCESLHLVNICIIEDCCQIYNIEFKVLVAVNYLLL